MERRKPKNGKPLSEYDMIYNAILEFHDHLKDIVEKTVKDNNSFAMKVNEALKNNAEKNNRSARRLLRLDLEKKIKELTDLHKTMSKESDDAMSILDDFQSMNQEPTPNLNAFVNDVDQIVQQINLLMEHFTMKIVFDFIKGCQRVLSDLEQKNKVEPNFTRLYSKNMMNNRNKSYHRKAAVKVGNKGSFANLKASRQTRRLPRKNTSSNNNNDFWITPHYNSVLNLH